MGAKRSLFGPSSPIWRGDELTNTNMVLEEKKLKMCNSACSLSFTDLVDRMSCIICRTRIAACRSAGRKGKKNFNVH